ncbi:MAG: hypothetical protein IPM82_10975 [Saprospiraceae bacterium]|nr:hypothetical protein [Saprospiraceae bacterium]
MYLLEDWRYGWQRFGEHMDNTFLDPFAEGAWMTKHNGKYYFQYGAPGTEFSGYSDGVVVGTSPLFQFQPAVPAERPTEQQDGRLQPGRWPRCHLSRQQRALLAHVHDGRLREKHLGAAHRHLAHWV